MKTIREYILNAPADSEDVAFTELSLPFGVISLAFVCKQEQIVLVAMIDSTNEAHLEKFAIVRSEFNAEKIFGKEPYGYANTVVMKNESLHICALPTAAEQEQARQQMLLQEQYRQKQQNVIQQARMMPPRPN